MVRLAGVGEGLLVENVLSHPHPRSKKKKNTKELTGSRMAIIVKVLVLNKLDNSAGILAWGKKSWV